MIAPLSLDSAAATPLTRVSTGLAFRGPTAYALEASYTRVAGAELRNIRLSYVVFTLLVFGTSLVATDATQARAGGRGMSVYAIMNCLRAGAARAAQAPGIVISTATSLTAVVALLIARRPPRWAARLPAWAEEGVSLAAASLLIVGLDVRQAGLQAECGECPDLITLLGAMPFLHCAMLAPRLKHIAPVLCGHAGFASYLFLSMTPSHGPMKTAVMLLCAVRCRRRAVQCGGRASLTRACTRA
jgi:hypothetical protein